MMEADLVQIHANKQEMMQRIKAFCSRKKEQIDDANVKTFCGVNPAQGERSTDYNSCARIDAVHFPIYNKSRFKVSSVANKEGPQLNSGETREHKPTADTNIGANIEDRVVDIEHHCNMSGRTDLSLIDRVKKLEDKILYLEGISLEYFNHPNKSFIAGSQSSNVDSNEVDLSLLSSAGTAPASTNDLSITQIDVRMQELKEKLRMKAMELG